jgi:hypothetical protein
MSKVGVGRGGGVAYSSLPTSGNLAHVSRANRGGPQAVPAAHDNHGT